MPNPKPWTDDVIAGAFVAVFLLTWLAGIAAVGWAIANGNIQTDIQLQLNLGWVVLGFVGVLLFGVLIVLAWSFGKSPFNLVQGAVQDAVDQAVEQQGVIEAEQQRQQEEEES